MCLCPLLWVFGLSSSHVLDRCQPNSSFLLGLEKRTKKTTALQCWLQPIPLCLSFVLPPSTSFLPLICLSQTYILVHPHLPPLLSQWSALTSRASICSSLHSRGFSELHALVAQAAFSFCAAWDLLDSEQVSEPNLTILLVLDCDSNFLDKSLRT